MNIRMWIFRKSTKKNNKAFHGRPQFLFNFEKQHWGGCFTEDVIKNNKMIQKKMGLKLTRILVSFQ